MITNPKSSRWNFIWQRNKPQLLVIAGLLIAVFILPYSLSKSFVDKFSSQWGQWLEAFLAFALVIVAVAIWLNEQREEWVKSLPKKLNIDYNLNGETYCQVIGAPLIGEDDIRQWGLSIAQSCLKDKTVKILFKGFQTTPGQVNRKMKFVQYHHTIYLKEKIDGISKGAVYMFNEEGTDFEAIEPKESNENLL